MTKIIKKYSNILFNTLNGNYPPSLALALSIPMSLCYFLPKYVSLPEGFKIVLNSPATICYNVLEEYELQEYSRCEDFIPKSGDVVFDIGAYVGIYALRSSKKVGDEGRVIAFEPNPTALVHLKNNLRINNVKNVEIFPVAIGDKKGKIEFYTTNEKNMNIESSSIFRFHIEQWEKNISKIAVEMDTLDNFIEKLGIDRIDIVKIDVEGAEDMVLKGARNALSSGTIRRLVIESHEDVVPLSKTIETLKVFDYNIEYVLRQPRTEVQSIIYAQKN